MSLRLKTSLLSALILGVILLGFGTAAWYLISWERLAAVDREIRTLASRHPGWFANRSHYDRLTSVLEFTFGEDRKDQVILWIRDSSGAELYRSPHWPAALDPLRLDLSLRDDPKAADAEEPAVLPSNRPGGAGPPWGGRGGAGWGGRGLGYGWGRGGFATFTKVPKFLTARVGGTAWRLGVLGNAQITLVLGINYDQVQDELNHLRGVFLTVLPLALLLAGLGGWVVGSRALRPLRIIAETAERVTSRGLDQRIPLAGADPEAARVIRVLNGMMDRLEKSFHQANRFTADASHELKTPLAIMQGEVENALKLAAPGSKEQQVFSNLLEETQRLKNITRNLLLLAQADSGQLRLSLEPIDFSDLLENALEDTRILASDLELTFEVQIEPNLRGQGDRALLSMALLNLLSNAVKYNQPHGRVSVQLKAHGDCVLLAVGNTGPGIPKEDQPRVFDRFFRARQAEERPVEGLGLGLSLAREIIRAHGGSVELEVSRPGWTLFTSRLQRALPCES